MGVEGKRLLVLGAGRGQIGLYKAAKEMGITTIAGTMPDNNPPGIPLADEVCFMNIANPDEVAKKAANLKLDGVATCCLDTGISALGKTCDSLGLTGLPEKAAIMCNDKSKMKKAFMEYGVSTAQYFEISNEEELKNALDKIKLPVIIKATDLQGSNGIYIAKTEKDAYDGFHAAMKLTKRSYCIVEEFIEGWEFGAQAFVYNNEVLFVMPHGDETYMSHLLYSFRTLTDINLYKEFARLVKSRRLSVRNFVNMFVYFSRSHYEADLIDKKMKGHVNKESIFYSYRFEYQPYVAMLLKKKWKLNSKIVSRAHRYDLYEEEHKGNYIPMREGILSKIDNIYPCSDHGTDYLRKRFPQYKQKVHTRFLGTIDHGEKEYLFNDKCYEIVSCSTVTKVKRLDLLINALSQIKTIPIKWTHYGDGILMDEIKKMAKDKLRDNIQYEFKGNVSNTELMKQYQDKNYYVFVNVSSSEGIPVSIMEATSFGIPCIATDAGGTKEIIRDKENGVLLSQNITANELTKKITDFCKLDSYQYKKNRNDARYFWNKKFNADYNYQKFINEISN